MYEIVIRSFDGESYSEEESRFITIDNSVDNSPPSFTPEVGQILLLYIVMQIQES